jgi:uncharacterized surface protein with fasciclin (FAS1) repeats
MKRTILRSTGAVGAAVIGLSCGLAACANDSGSKASARDLSSSSTSVETGLSEAPGVDGAGEQTFGDGCSAIPTSGKGSFNGMITDPVATAASNNPLLTTLVAAFTEADLVDTLNGAEALTVFAPTDEAFGKITEKDLNAVLADKATLTAILTHHVITEQLDGNEVVGGHDSLNGDPVTVEGNIEKGMTVDGGAANVICGNIPTANATVYVIDTVLMPSGM